MGVLGAAGITATALLNPADAIEGVAAGRGARQQCLQICAADGSRRVLVSRAEHSGRGPVGENLHFTGERPFLPRLKHGEEWPVARRRRPCIPRLREAASGRVWPLVSPFGRICLQMPPCPSPSSLLDCLPRKRHRCPRCGLVLDRDHNAALNIWQAAAQTLENDRTRTAG
jgi:hypothetical protein